MKTVAKLGILAALVLASPLVIMAQRPTTKTMKRLPDTGQNGDFTTVPGEDSDIKIGAPGYIIQQDVVIDTVTGLMWQRTDGGEMIWEKGATYCDGLELGGFSDWRMPTSQELFTIHDLGRKNPALPEAFTNTGAEYWFSSDALVGDATRIWSTNSGGGIGPHPKTETVSAGGTKKFHVRAVRAMQPPVTIPVHYTDMGGDLVRDNATDLIWQQYCYPVAVSWEEALRIADTLTLGGFSDWRMPNIKELHTIREQQEKGPCVDLLYFPCVSSTTTLWSSTTLISQTNDQAWTLKGDLGIITYDKKTLKMKLMCVRGGTPDVTSVDDDTPSNDTGLYPNPSSGFVSLPAGTIRVTLYDITGTAVLTSNASTSIDVSSLPAGSYYCILVDGANRARTLSLVKR